MGPRAPARSRSRRSVSYIVADHHAHGARTQQGRTSNISQTAFAQFIESHGTRGTPVRMLVAGATQRGTANAPTMASGDLLVGYNVSTGHGSRSNVRSMQAA